MHATLPGYHGLLRILFRTRLWCLTGYLRLRKELIGWSSDSRRTDRCNAGGNWSMLSRSTRYKVRLQCIRNWCQAEAINTDSSRLSGRVCIYALTEVKVCYKQLFHSHAYKISEHNARMSIMGEIKKWKLIALFLLDVSILSLKDCKI